MNKLAAIVLLTFSADAFANAPKLPPQLQGIGIQQRLNAQLPLNTQFVDESGNPVRLGQYFGSKPVILALVYYTCPMLCNQILSGLVAGLRPLRLKPGRDFEIVAISINPAETPKDAAAKRNYYSASYSRRGGMAGWHFLTGKDPAIHAVANAAGFHFRYDPPTKMFIHASGVMVATPEGRMARYFYGVEYEPKDLKLGLVEASHNKIGSVVDQILLFCYHYDPTTGKYGAVVVNLLRVTAAAVLLLLAGILTILWRRDIRNGRQELERTRQA